MIVNSVVDVFLTIVITLSIITVLIMKGYAILTTDRVSVARLDPIEEVAIKLIPPHGTP